MPSPITGQVALTGTAQQVDPNITAGDCQAFTLKAPLTNTAQAFIGASGVTSGTGYQLDPGDELAYERIAQNGLPRYELRPSDFYAVGTTGDKVCWLASR